jgi:hypothetical protein
MHRAAVIAVLAAFVATAAGAQEPDEERIFTFIKGTPVKELDSALPKMRFERWLLDVVGKGVELRWSINDCGEQAGDPDVDAKRDLPICAGVEARTRQGPRVSSPAGHRHAEEGNRRQAQAVLHRGSGQPADVGREAPARSARGTPVACLSISI